MAHELELNKNGEASFAYRKEGGAPWHGLGVAMRGHQTMEAMLEAAHADYEVSIVPTYIVSPIDGKLVPVENSYSTARTNPLTGEYQSLGTVKGRYTVMQNRETLERALAVVGASRGDAVFDTLGVLYDGRQFFATIDLGTLVIDPAGVADKIGRFLVVRSGHDGSTPLTFSNTDIRAVCKNTVIMAERHAHRVFRAKHTPNIEARLEEAQAVLGLSTEWAKEFMTLSMEMLSIPMTAGKFDRVIDAVFPEDEANTDRKKNNRDEIVGQIKMIYANDKNAKRVGDNGWAAWNAIVEYFDHHRGGTAEERALTSMDDSSWVTRKKAIAQHKVLALA